jgi:hypothetical protein
MDAGQRLTSAKKKLLKETLSEDWCVGVGVGKVDARVGLTLSVREGARPAAQGLLEKLHIDVPVQIREVGPIRARMPAPLSPRPSPDPRALSQLRAAAARRGAR